MVFISKSFQNNNAGNKNNKLFNKYQFYYVYKISHQNMKTQSITRSLRTFRSFRHNSIVTRWAWISFHFFTLNFQIIVTGEISSYLLRTQSSYVLRFFSCVKYRRNDSKYQWSKNLWLHNSDFCTIPPNTLFPSCKNQYTMINQFRYFLQHFLFNSHYKKISVVNKEKL